MPNWFSTPVGSGMNGCQFAGLMKNAPTTMNRMITVTLIATMMLLTVADSETPITSSMVTASVMNTAGRLNIAGTTAERGDRDHRAARKLHDGLRGHVDDRSRRELAQSGGRRIEHLRRRGQRRLGVGVDGDVDRIR